MQLNQLAVRFTDTAAEEVNLLIRAMKLVPLAEYLSKNDEPLPAELNGLLGNLLNVITDLFSIELPSVDADPEETLRKVSRDINLSRLLRERGLFRLYRLLHELVWVDPFTGDELAAGPEEQHPDAVQVPRFMTLVNPNTGAPFATQEEFVGWFCEEAHVARGLVFMRLATIDKTLDLGFTLEQAFDLIARKPSVIRETLEQIKKMGAIWEDGELVSVKPDVAVMIASKVSPGDAKEIEALAAEAEEDPEKMAQLRDAFKPVLADLLEEIALHERAKDAMDFVKFDVLGKSKISYVWDASIPALVVEIERKGYTEDGEEYVAPPIRVPFIPDTLELPDEVVQDLLKRLPVKNRRSLDP